MESAIAGDHWDFRPIPHDFPPKKRQKSLQDEPQCPEKNQNHMSWL